MCALRKVKKENPVTSNLVPVIEQQEGAGYVVVGIEGPGSSILAEAHNSYLKKKYHPEDGEVLVYISAWTSSKHVRPGIYSVVYCMTLRDAISTYEHSPGDALFFAIQNPKDKQSICATHTSPLLLKEMLESKSVA